MQQALDEYKHLVQQAQLLLREEYSKGAWVQADRETFQYFRERVPKRQPSKAQPQPPRANAPKSNEQPIKTASPDRPTPKPSPTKVRPRRLPPPAPKRITKESSSAPFAFEKEAVIADESGSFDELQGILADVAPHMSRHVAPPSKQQLRKKMLQEAQLVLLLPTLSKEEQRLAQDLLLGLRLASIPAAAAPLSEKLPLAEMSALRCIACAGEVPRQPLELTVIHLPPIAEWIADPAIKQSIWEKLAS